jgi:ACS family hexuronate transporter-like MFS transporter
VDQQRADVAERLLPGERRRLGRRLGGMGAGIGAILFTQATGFVVDHFSYTPILIAAGLLPLAGTGLLFVLGGRIKRVA